MEESWQIKCSSTMPSSAPSLVSSSSSLELRNHMENSASYVSYPDDLRDLRRRVLGATQGPVFSDYLNLGSQKSSNVGLGNSFLALLSGPPSILQCDFNEFSNPKITSDSNVVDSVRVETATTFNGPPPVYSNQHNLQVGADSCFPKLHNTVPSNAGKVFSTKFQVSSVQESFPRTPSALSNCPRVFCLATSGYLLISNTGLLGVVCACHSLHMSVLKFCEHSGLSGSNAGDSIRLESGESIATWRKLYFQKFGIRIPDDQSDWDWPEGVPVTSGLVKFRTSLPPISGNVSHLPRPSEEFLRSSQILEPSLNKNPNLVSHALHDKQKRNGQDGCSVPPNSLFGTLQDSRTTRQKSDFSLFKNAPNNVFVGGDAVLSNIELKLGQPCQSSQNFKTSLVNPTKFVSAPVTPDAANCQPGKVETGQPLSRAAGPCGPNQTREQSYLKNNGFEIRNVNDAYTLEKSRGYPAQNAVVSLLSNPGITKSDSSYDPGTAGNGFARQPVHAEMGSDRLIDKGKGLKYASDGPYFVKDKEIKTSSSYPFVSAAQASGCDLYQLPSMPLESPEPEARTFCNYAVNNMPSSASNLQADFVNRRCFTSSTCLLEQTPALLSEEGNCLSPRLLDDTSRILALNRILELSSQQHTISSFGMNRREGNSHIHQTIYESSVSREFPELPPRTHVAACPTNINGCCDLSTLIQGIPLRAKQIDARGQIFSEPLQNEHFSTSRSQKNISGPEHERCHEAPSVCFQQGCNCSFHKNLVSNIGSFSDALQEKRGTKNGEISVKFGSKFCQNYLIPNGEIHSVNQDAKSSGKLSKNIVGQTSQWRDVPTKMKGVIGTGTSGPMQIKSSHKEHEDSNISSESSAPAVTQLSVEFSNMDSSNADAENTGCVNNAFVDEGSGIDRCWSSDDAHGSERSAEFLGDSWKSNSKNSHHHSSRSLIDELKLIDSLTWKKGNKQIKTQSLQDKDNPWSILHSTKKPIRKRDVYKLYNEKDASANYETPEDSGRKKYENDPSSALSHSPVDEEIHNGARSAKKIRSSDCSKPSSNFQRNDYSFKWRPVVCGKYGELSNGELVCDGEKTAKIVPLRTVLKSARRCTLPKSQKSFLTSARKLKNTNSKESNESDSEFQCSDTQKESRSPRDGKTYNETSFASTIHKCTTNDNNISEELPLLKLERNQRMKKDNGEEDISIHGQMRSKVKEIRRRSIYELTADGNGAQQQKSSLSEVANCHPELSEGNMLRNADDRKKRLCKVDEKSPQERTCTPTVHSDSFCCVCGSSNKDEANYLLECKACLIRVHQACYGVARYPKGQWYCRPCQTNSQNIVCVLCGYGGGAMTRALRSRSIAKSLMKVWNTEAQCKAKNIFLPVKSSENSLSGLNCFSSECEGGTSASATELLMDNSITKGWFDSTTKQWVHMVCGLWTPGTRCPNVDTMSAFDVSGATCPKSDMVCSICNRPGGSCIKCRVLNCAVPFHPWCAHQKGLLQSEVEGVDDENVGFYGRCLLHATHPMCESVSELVSEVEGILTCARTEGYKGRKHDGFWHNYGNQSKRKVGCHVPQEQLNAWNHINGQRARSTVPSLPKPPVSSDTESDCRKEYFRYKQERGWKHLVVYKSGIHALGLYTSCFMSRGEMVVEYVGEIVGQRVSDRREIEYQSGRKLPYKSACYFFRIDKEHIIDATRKGGIARFVNHSCLPNCVAKVIPIKSEKKVIFFAERDIFPGEEITYDYHFKHEDEGMKIPCFCNSRNCRRYLN